MTSPKTNLYTLTRAEMEAFIVALGEPKFRANQVWHWLYRSLVASFDEQRNCPNTFQYPVHAARECIMMDAEVALYSGEVENS